MSEINDLVDEYLGVCRAKNLSERTLRVGYGYPLQRVLLPWCERQGIERLVDLTQRRLDGLSSELLGRQGRTGTISRFTVQSYLNPVATFLRWARAEGEAVGDAMPRRIRKPKVIREVLSRAEIDRLEEACDGERNRLIVRLLADTGLRVGELVALRAEDIVQQEGEWYLHVHGKGGRERWVPIPRLHRRLVKHARYRGGGWLFPAARRVGDERPQLGAVGVRILVRDAARRAGIERRVWPHLLRHSCITWLLSRGLNPFQVSQITGNFSVLGAYAHLKPSDGHAAILRVLTEEGS